MRIIKLFLWVLFIIFVIFIYNDFKSFLDEEKKRKANIAEKNMLNQESTYTDTCIVLQGIVYYYLKDNEIKKPLNNDFKTTITEIRKKKSSATRTIDYMEMRILKINQEEKKALVYIQSTRSIGKLVYDKKTYTKGERLWVDTYLLNCSPPNIELNY